MTKIAKDRIIPNRDQARTCRGLPGPNPRVLGHRGPESQAWTLLYPILLVLCPDLERSEQGTSKGKPNQIAGDDATRLADNNPERRHTDDNKEADAFVGNPEEKGGAKSGIGKGTQKKDGGSKKQQDNPKKSSEENDAKTGGKNAVSTRIHSKKMVVQRRTTPKRPRARAAQKVRMVRRARLA